MLLDDRELEAIRYIGNDVLGGVVPALEQVAVYVRETPGMSFSKLRKEGIWRELRDAPKRGMEHNYKLIMAAVFEVVVKNVEERNPGAVGIARMMAYLASDDVPGDLLWPRSLNTLVALERARVIQKGRTAHAFFMQRFQQEVVRDGLAGKYEGLFGWAFGQDRGQETLDKVVGLLRRAWNHDPEHPRTRKQAKDLAGNIRAVWKHARGNDRLAASLLPLMDEIARL